MPAPALNMNAVKNGSRINRLILGNWPKALNRVQRFSRQYREMLEKEVVARHGEVSLLSAHLIDAACQHEATRQVCRWILRERWDRLKPADIERNSLTMGSATDRRNAAVAKLELGAAPADPWSVLDSQRSLSPPEASADEADAGEEPKSGDLDGDSAGDGRTAAPATAEPPSGPNAGESFTGPLNEE